MIVPPHSGHSAVNTVGPSSGAGVHDTVSGRVTLGEAFAPSVSSGLLDVEAAEGPSGVWVGHGCDSHGGEGSILVAVGS